MKHDQFNKLLEYIDARIAEKISDAFGRDGLHEAVARADVENELRELFQVYP